MGIKNELGQKIKRMRINRGLTQEELSEKIDISQRALSRIENGENFVSADTLDKLLLALNTTTEELFSLSHLKNKQEMYKDIENKIKFLMNNDYKFEILYNFICSLSKE